MILEVAFSFKDMKTIVLNEPGQLSLTETPPFTESTTHEALVRVHRVGICGSDLHAFKGEQPFFTYPRVGGHRHLFAHTTISVHAEHLNPLAAVRFSLATGDALPAVQIGFNGAAIANTQVIPVFTYAQDFHSKLVPKQ